MTFRDRLFATIRAARPVLDVPELQHVVRSNLTILSLLAPRSGLPDPEPRRAEVAALLHRLEAAAPEAR